MDRVSSNPWVLSLADQHRPFYDFNVGFANYSRGEVFLYQSKQFLENEIRTRLTNKYHAALPDFTNNVSIIKE